MSRLDFYLAWQGLGLLPVWYLGLATAVPLSALGQTALWPIFVACAVGGGIGWQLARVAGRILEEETDSLKRRAERLSDRFAFPRLTAAFVVVGVLFSPMVFGFCLYLLSHKLLA